MSNLPFLGVWPPCVCILLVFMYVMLPPLFKISVKCTMPLYVCVCVCACSRIFVLLETRPIFQTLLCGFQLHPGKLSAFPSGAGRHHFFFFLRTKHRLGAFRPWVRCRRIGLFICFGTGINKRHFLRFLGRRFIYYVEFGNNLFCLLFMT